MEVGSAAPGPGSHRLLLAVPLPALLAVMVYLWADARDARDAAEADRAAAVAAKDAAERDRALTQGYLRSTVAGVDRILDRVGDERLARIPGFHADRAAILDDATAMFESLLRIDSGEPTVRHETAQTYLRVARLGALGGRHAEAIAAAQSAIDLLTALSAEQPDRPDYRHDLARAYSGMGTARLVEADFAAAQVAYEKTVGLCSALTEQFPDAMEYRVTGAEARRFLGLFLIRTDPARAQDHFSAALEIAEDFFRREPESADARTLLAVSLGHYGQFLAVRGKPVEAERMLLRGWELVDPARHPNLPPPSARTRNAQALDALRNGLGQLYLNSGRLERAEAMLRAAAAEAESLIAGNPKSFPYRLQAMNAYSDLSAVFNAQNNQPEAARTFSRALALLDDLVRDFPRAAWLPMQRRGLAFKHAFALARAGRRSEAATAARNFTRTADRIAGGNAYNIACLFALLVKDAPPNRADAIADEAIGWLKRATETGYPENAEQVAAAKTDDDLASLRGRPAFDLWLKELKPIPPKMKP